MPSAPDSRSASAYAHMYEYDLREFAWEYLRRNPDYQQDYRAAVRRAEQTGGKDSCSLGTALSLSIRSCRQTPLLLRTPEAARFLGLSGRTLEKHRTYGTGPKYRKIGGRVVYALDDLKIWADLGAKISTSDPGAGTVLPAKRVALPGHINGHPHRR